jgi:hypothetical protein
MTPFCLLVVAKAPVPGFAKTRLSPPATPEQAATIAAAALLDTLAVIDRICDAVPVLALTGDLELASDAPRLRTALASWPVIRQRGSGLGDRLANAHLDASARCDGLPVVQIGMDTPQVTAEALTAVAMRLTDHDVVLGPATDGGWWGLGLRDPAKAAALRTVRMSRADTAVHTLAALTHDRSRASLAGTLSDVDTMADALDVAAMTPGSRFAAAVAQVGAGMVG